MNSKNILHVLQNLDVPAWFGIHRTAGISETLKRFHKSGGMLAPPEAV